MSMQILMDAKATAAAGLVAVPEDWFTDLESNVSHFFVEAEQDVVKVVAQVKADIDVAIQDIDSALKWLANQTPAIAAGLATAASLIEQVGLVSNPEVAAAIQAANIAVQGLNAFAAAANTGKTMPQAVVDGYTAYKSAQAAVASAAAVAAKTPTPAAGAAVVAAAQ